MLPKRKHDDSNADNDDNLDNYNNAAPRVKKAKLSEKVQTAADKIPKKKPVAKKTVTQKIGAKNTVAHNAPGQKAHAEKCNAEKAAAQKLLAQKPAKNQAHEKKQHDADIKKKKDEEQELYETVKDILEKSLMMLSTTMLPCQSWILVLSDGTMEFDVDHTRERNV